MFHSQYASLTNDEITRHVSSHECTQLEQELSARLVEAEHENKELASACQALPPLTKGLIA